MLKSLSFEPILGGYDKSLAKLVVNSVSVSRFYGISPKAVRDIWNRFVCTTYPIQL